MNTGLLILLALGLGGVIAVVIMSSGERVPSRRALPESRHLTLPPEDAGDPGVQFYTNEETWEIEWANDLPVRVVVHRDARRA